MLLWSRSEEWRAAGLGLVWLAGGCTVSWKPSYDAGTDPAASLSDASETTDAADDGSLDSTVVRPDTDASPGAPDARTKEILDAGCPEAGCDAPPDPGPVRATGFEGASCAPEGATTVARTKRVRAGSRVGMATCERARPAPQAPCAMQTPLRASPANAAR